MTKVKKVKMSLVGTVMPPKTNGEAGRYLEQLMMNAGYELQQGPGPDMKLYGLEIKSRDIDSTSAITIGSMTDRRLAKIQYKKSDFAKKLQQIFYVKIKDRVIISAEVLDLSDAYLQSKFKEAYDLCVTEISKYKLKHGNLNDMLYAKGTSWAHLERRKGKKSWTFRITKGSFSRMERTINSTFNDFFTV